MLAGMIGPPLDGHFSGRAAELLDGCWSSTTSGPADVIPDGVVDVMWTPGTEPWIAGPDTTPRRVTLPAGTQVIGLRLRSGVAAGLLGDRVDLITDRSIALGDVWPTAAARRLREELAELDQPIDRARAVARAIVERLDSDWHPDPVVVATAAALRRCRVPADSGVGERQVRRRFVAAMGYGPAFYRRIVRLDRATTLLAERPNRPVAETATVAGYYDEAHFARDSMALTGRTPGQWRGL